jgi:hypothetical protein
MCIDLNSRGAEHERLLSQKYAKTFDNAKLGNFARYDSYDLLASSIDGKFSMADDYVRKLNSVLFTFGSFAVAVSGEVVSF